MRRKAFVIVGVAMGVLALVAILCGPAVPLLVRLGVEPICIRGELPHLQVVSCSEAEQAQPTVTPQPLPTLRESSPIPIIVDDDGSPDGVIALLFFLRHPHYDVQAVTVSQGEAHPDLFAPHVARLLAAVGRPDIPVGVGRATPLEGDNAFPEPWRESSDAFWSISLPEASTPVEPLPAAELMVETLSESARPMAVFISGTHTNLAEALRLEPEIRERIRDVYVMGGSIDVPGNIESDWPEISNRVAEWNIWVDPVAAREVFASGLPLHIMPLDGTRQVVWNRADVPAWASSGTPEGSWAAEVLQWMLESWSPEGVYVWDLAAAVATTDPELCPEAILTVDVEVQPGPEQGRTAVVDGPPNAQVCLEPDVGQIKARAAMILGR